MFTIKPSTKFVIAETARVAVCVASIISLSVFVESLVAKGLGLQE